MENVSLEGLYTALVSMPLGSLPWLGSVKPKQPRISPRAAQQNKERNERVTILNPDFFFFFKKRLYAGRRKRRSYQAEAGTSPSGPLCRMHWWDAWPAMTGRSWLTDSRCPLSLPLWRSSHTPHNSCPHSHDLQRGKKKTNIHRLSDRDKNHVQMLLFLLVSSPLMVEPKTPISPISEIISRWKSVK